MAPSFFKNMSHPLLNKWLNKLKIEKVNDLSFDEQETYRKWDSVLSKKDLTVDDIKEFCQQELDFIDEKWADKQDPKLISYRVVYSKLIKIIGAPQIERASLEGYLINLIKKE